MAKAVTIHTASARDAADSLKLLLAQFREHRIRTPRARVLSCIRDMIRRPQRGFILIARLESRAVGVAYVPFTCTLEHGGLTSWLEELYVIPELRNRGIGRELLTAVISRAGERGCAAIDLEVEADHARAVNLYRRAGFKPLTRSRWARKITRRLARR
jgi:GNAT superfamily N-acetyltransferase